MSREVDMIEEAEDRVRSYAETFNHPASERRIISIALDVAREHYGKRLASRLLDPEPEED